jgi:hypothetical protein
MMRLTQLRKKTLLLELLENRYAPANLVVPLIPQLDQFGAQIGAYQAYGDGDVVESIFDTGASAITFSPGVQEYLQIPIKVPGGAVAGGVGGEITGDVSMPGTVYVDGLHAVDLSDFFDLTNFDFSTFTMDLDPNAAAAAPGVQALVGTFSGSPNLPTIAGTPILNPSPAHPNGLAAKVDLQGYSFDLLAGLREYLPEFSDSDLIWQMPDLHFVEPGTLPSNAADTVGPVYVPMSFFGADNHTNPGDGITETGSPVQPNVGLTYQVGMPSLTGKQFLFDTGAQLSIISTATAEALGIDLSNPETTMTVAGVGGQLDIPGFTLRQLDVPTTNGDKLVFTDVPVYVLDVAPELDGILGMNLFNTANSMVYDPFNPAGSRVGLTFHTTPRDVLPDVDEGFGFFLDVFPFYAGLLQGHALPGFDIGAATPGNVATTTTLGATPNASTGGSLVTFTATVAPSPGALGTVSFFDNGVALPGASNVALVGGVATFQISSLATGNHSISAAYSGAPGFQASTSSNLTYAVAPPAPKVVSVTPNADAPSLSANPNSRVVSVVATFDQPVQLDENALRIELHTNNVVYNGAVQASGFGTLPTSLVLTPSSDKKTWTVTFSGNTEDGADGLKSLKDGVYDLNIDAAKVHPLGTPGVSMAGNSTTTFHRLFGDSNPPSTPSGGTAGADFQAIVNTGDNLAFRSAFNNPAAYKSHFDFNGDGVINTGDNLQFRNRFNRGLTWSV